MARYQSVTTRVVRVLGSGARGARPVDAATEEETVEEDEEEEAVAVVEEGGEAEDEDEEAGDPTAVEVLAARLLLYVGAPHTERPQSAILTMPSRRSWETVVCGRAFGTMTTMPEPCSAPITCAPGSRRLPMNVSASRRRWQATERKR